MSRVRRGSSTPLWAVVLLAASGCARTGDSSEPPPGTPVRFSIDGSRTHPISPFIYGVNFRHFPNWGANDVAITTLNRLGGNRLTAYNWLSNESNCGADCGTSFPNDLFLAQQLENPAERGGFARRAIEDTFARGTAAVMVTVPIAGHVAGDHGGSTLPLPIAKNPATPAVPDPRRFKRSLPRRGPGSESDAGVVYQDEFVRFLDQRFPGAIAHPRKAILFQLDNEPDLWGSTHPELRGTTAEGEPVLLGFDELVSRTLDYAAAIKDAAPQARVFAAPLSNWYGFWGLGHKARPQGYEWYVDYYLEKLRQAQEAQGRRLVDALSVHWYPEGRNECRPGESPCWIDRITNDWQPQSPSVIEARVQAPRSLWDARFTERSWVAENVPGCWGRSCPVQLIPRLKASIAARYPGTELAITEYYFGRGGDISGAIAQADALGIFGREGLAAAALWPAAQVYAWSEQPKGGCDSEQSCSTRAYGCVFAAFRAFLDFDGKGGRFGESSVSAETSHVPETSVYASRDERSGRVVVVAINKAGAPLQAELRFANLGSFSRADVYRVTGGIGECRGPEREAALEVAGASSVPVSLPPWSIGVYDFHR